MSLPGLPKINLDVAATNPWVTRARKFLIAGALAVVEIANVWIGGPKWLYGAAAVLAMLLSYFVPNAPKYTDPRATAVAQSEGEAIH